MTELQKVLLKLLLEFDKVCTSLDVEYSCADRLAWDATKFHKFHDKTYDAYLVMQFADVERLSEELRSIPFRECEFYTAGASQFFRYIASDTTLIDLDSSYYFSHPGIALTIQLLDEPDPNGFVSYRIDDDELDFPISTFFPASKATFEGHLFPVPSDVDSYFAELVSPEWRKKKYTRSIRRERFSVVFDTELGYQRLLEKPIVKDILSPPKQRQRQEYLEKEASLKHITSKPATYAHAADLTYWRFQFWEEYYPLRSQIEAYLAASDLKALSEMLTPCLKKLIFFAKRGLGLYFDPTVHKALVFVSTEAHGESFTLEWTASIPDAHYEDVAQVLRRHGVNHPLLD